ncbi:MAG: hypothetical protein AB7G93_23285 [Bdellovibrionales bacterium]
MKIQRVFLDAVVKDKSGVERRIPKFITDPAEAIDHSTPDSLRTSVFANLLAFKHALLNFGAAKQISLAWIVNFHTVMELNIKERIWQRDHDGAEISNEVRSLLIEGTSLYRYGEQVAEATGHRIRGVKVSGGELQPYSSLLTYDPGHKPDVARQVRAERNRKYFEEGKQEALLKGLTLRESDPVLRNFYLTFDVEPWNAGR